MRQKIRQFVRRCNKKGWDFLRWIWAQCKDWKTVVLLGIVSLVLYSPAIVGWIIGFLFGWDWAWVTATLYAAFWLGPGSPFFLIAVTATLAIKGFFGRLRNRGREKQTPEETAPPSDGAENGEE